MRIHFYTHQEGFEQLLRFGPQKLYITAFPGRHFGITSCIDQLCTVYCNSAAVISLGAGFT